MRIRVRLALLFAAGTAAVAVLGGIVFVHELSGGLQKSMLVSLQTRVNAVGQEVPGRGQEQQVRDPGVPVPIGSVGDSESLTQVISVAGVVLDASGPGTLRSLLSRVQRTATLRHSTVLTRHVPGQSTAFLLLASPTDDRNRIVVVGETLETLQDAVHRVEVGIIVGGAVGVLAAGLAAWLLAGAALAPVERMRRQAADISEHDGDAMLAVPRTHDEVAALAHTINGLLARLHGALGRQRELVSAAGHELRTPLSILRGELELAERPGRSVEDLRNAVHEAASQTDHLIHLSEDLLLLSRSDESDPLVLLAPEDLVSLVRSFVASFEGRAAERGVALEVAGPDALPAVVDAPRLRQMVDNLVDNALRFSPPGTVVTVRISSGAGQATVEVLDRGPGFPVDYLPKAFDRFWRGDSSRSRDHGGAGLGLAIVKSLATAHGGNVEEGNRPGGGARVAMTLPRCG